VDKLDVENKFNFTEPIYFKLEVCNAVKEIFPALIVYGKSLDQHH